MGRVLSFMPRAAAINRPPRDVDLTAAVIIFPGVRYERQRESGELARGLGQAKPRPSLSKPSRRH